MITFSNGEKLAFCDPRRMGRIRIKQEPLLSPPISSLAPDPLIDGPLSKEQFVIKLAKCTAPIKSILLDQEKLCCGIGNWVADEVLYQASIHPETPGNVIASCVSDVARLVDTIHSILEQAVEANADDSAFPPDWLFHRRWGKGKGVEGVNTMRNGNVSIVRIMMSSPA
jgi:formamidopyrimidine-DNA glycosylase